LPLPGSDRSCGFRSSPVERQNAAVKDLVNGAIKGGGKQVAPAAGR
jgi:hypothetical protein